MASRPIQLPMRAKPARRVSKLRPQELYERLRQIKPVCKIFRTYMRRRGYPDALFLFLWRYVCPPYRFRAKAAKRAVARLAAAIDDFGTAIATLLEGIPPDALDARAHPFLKRLIHVRKDLDIWDSAIREDPATRPPGRPPGGSPSNLAAAVLAREFRRRFGRPRWGDIATLIEAVDPKRFAKIKVGNLPSEVVRRSVNHILIEHEKVVKKHWIGFFGKTSDWPGPQFADW